MQELRRRHFLALRIEQAQEHLVVLVAVAAQADDWLEQQAEAVGLQRLLEDRDDVAALGGGGKLFRRVVLLDLRPALACRVIGAAMRTVHHVLGLGGLLVETGDADAEGGLGAAAVQLEKVVLDFLQQSLQRRLRLLGSLALEQGGEDRIAETRQVGFLAELFTHQSGQLAEQQVDPGKPVVGLERGVAVEMDIGQGRRLAGGHRLLHGGIHQVEEVAAVVETGDRVLAADFAELFFQLGVVDLAADHHLDAGFAVVRGGGEADARLEFLAVELDPGANQFGLALVVLVALEEILEGALVAGGDQVDDRQAFQFLGVLVAEQRHVGAVGVDVHAVVDVGDGVDRAVEQQLAAFFRLAQGEFGGAARAAFGEAGQLAVGDQHQALVLALRQGVLGAEHQGVGDGVGAVVGHQLDERDVARLAAQGGERLAGLETLAGRRGDQQVPALLEGFGEVLGRGQSMYAGRVAGIAEQTDQAFGFVLRVFQNQQADGFLFDGHGKGSVRVRAGAKRRRMEVSGQSTETSRASQNLPPPQAAGPLAL